MFRLLSCAALLCTSTMALATTTVISQAPRVQDIDTLSSLNSHSLYLQTPANTVRVFYLYNKSKRPLLLNHPDNSGSAKAGWGSEIDAHRWSLIILPNGPKTKAESFEITCQHWKPFQHQTIDCHNVLKYGVAKATIPKGFATGYWLVENKSLKGAMSAAKKRGVSVNLSQCLCRQQSKPQPLP